MLIQEHYILFYHGIVKGVYNQHPDGVFLHAFRTTSVDGGGTDTIRVLVANADIHFFNVYMQCILLFLYFAL
jgi:hypothetical protein